jgi:hypothetical protein
VNGAYAKHHNVGNPVSKVSPSSPKRNQVGPEKILVETDHAWLQVHVCALALSPSPVVSELREPRKFTVYEPRKIELRDLRFDILWIASPGLSMSHCHLLGEIRRPVGITHEGFWFITPKKEGRIRTLDLFHAPLEPRGRSSRFDSSPKKLVHGLLLNFRKRQNNKIPTRLTGYIFCCFLPRKSGNTA